MDTSDAKSKLAGGRFSDLRWVPETGSTNDDLLAKARSGSGEQVLVADLQRAGRGRLGRTWQAPPGASLLCSFLVRPALALADAHVVPWAVALGARDAATAVAGVDLALKWPNDLVALGRGADGADAKVAGVLSELVPQGDRLSAIVVGIGINVNWGGHFPRELEGSAASLDGLSGAPVGRGELLVAMVQSTERWLARAEGGDVEALRAAVAASSATLGREVLVERARGSIRGLAVALEPSGALLVEADGEVTAVDVGDVVNLRPTGAQPN